MAQEWDAQGNPIASSAPVSAPSVSPTEWDANGKPIIASASSTPDITANPNGEGTYSMWNDKGQKLGIPYSQVPVAVQKGYQFDTNPTASGLTPAQQFAKDQTADPGHVGGTSLFMGGTPATQADYGTGGNLVGGIAKGLGTLATPVLDLGNLIAKHTGGNPADINAMLAAHGAAQTVGKFGTIGATILPSAIANPVGTATTLAGGAVGGGIGHVVGNATGMSPEATAVLSDATGLAGGIGGAKLSGVIAPLVQSAAAGDPDAAALRGLQVGPKSPKALSTLSAVDNARPFLQGAQNLEDLQSRIAPAKAAIWQPYQQAIEAIGNRPVQGPDGMTTVADLEDQRLQLSALNRGLKSNLPEAIQLAQQKGMTAAQLLQQEAAVKAALDPELESTGINPQLIRKVFGSVAQIGQRVSGKSTLIEPEQPSGLGKIANISIKQPLQGPAQIVSGLRDILAGRPLYSAKPTDLGIREGFANAGPMPDFGTPAPQFTQPPLQLGGGATVLPEQPLQNVGTSSPAINIAPDTRAARLGLLLKAPPIELPGAIAQQVPAYTPDTAAARLGRLLPSESVVPTPTPPIQLPGAVAQTPPPPVYAGSAASRLGRLLTGSKYSDIPLSDKADIFPDQIPQAVKINSQPVISPKLTQILKRTGR